MKWDCGLVGCGALTAISGALLPVTERRRWPKWSGGIDEEVWAWLGLSLNDPTLGADAGPAKVASALAGFLTGF